MCECNACGANASECVLWDGHWALCGDEAGRRSWGEVRVEWCECGFRGCRCLANGSDRRWREKRGKKRGRKEEEKSEMIEKRKEVGEEREKSARTKI